MKAKNIFIIVAVLILPTASCLLPVCFSQGGTWTQKANYMGGPRGGVVGFAIGTKGYYACGWQFSNYIYYKDLWEWDKPTNTWTQKASMTTQFGNGAVLGRGDASGFSIGNKGYIGTGFTGNAGAPDENKFWEWDQPTNTWLQTTNYNSVMYCGRSFGVGFAIANKGYIGTGYSMCGTPPGGLTTNYFVEWDPATAAWTQKASLPGVARAKAVGISIGNKGYIGTGEDQAQLPLNDWWEWDPGIDAWSQKADVPGPKRMYAAGFSIGADGYLGTGWDGAALLKDFYRYTPATNTWAQMTDYPHPVCDIDHATFTIGCQGYFGCGATHPNTPGTYFNDFWEYTPPGVPVAMVSGNTSICFGQSATLNASGGTSYSWSTGATTATIIVQPTGTTTTYSVVVSNGSACDDYAGITVNILYPPVVPTVSNATICAGQTAALTASGGGNYSWSNGNTNSTINVSPAITTTYSVTTSNSCGSSTASGTVTVVSNITATVTSSTICLGQTATLTASGGSSYSWNTGATTATITDAPSITTTYTVIVSDANGCSDAASITVPVANCCVAAAVISSDPSSTVCVGAQVFVSASGGTTYSWNTGATTANIMVTPSVTTAYVVMVTDANGCTGTATLTVPVDTGCTATGIAQFNADAIQVDIVPNPSNGVFRIGVPSAFKEGIVEIYSVMGEKIFSSPMEGIQDGIIDLSLQPRGMYYVQVSGSNAKVSWGSAKTGKKILHKKIVIHK